MFDLSSKFNKFYTSYVVLPQEKQNELYDIKDLNIKRLKEGLEEYNTEHKTDYKILEIYESVRHAFSEVLSEEKQYKKLSNLLQKMNNQGVVGVHGSAVHAEWFLL